MYHKNKWADFLKKIGKAAASLTYNIPFCVFVFHEPQMPESIKKQRFEKYQQKQQKKGTIR